VAHAEVFQAAGEGTSLGGGQVLHRLRLGRGGVRQPVGRVALRDGFLAVVSAGMSAGAA
jgi:hypothetical protein